MRHLRRTQRAWLQASGVALAFALAAPAAAQPGMRVGYLTCEVAGGFGFVFGSSRSLQCTFSTLSGERVGSYRGSISRFGADEGYVQGGILAWGVVAPVAEPAAGTLAGRYRGAASVATDPQPTSVSTGSHVLVGGAGRTVALQPVRIEGGPGLNAAPGVAALTLTELY